MLPSGTKLGPYEIRRLLGAGGMGEVYCAHDPRLGREVAIKVLGTNFVSSESAVERFQREAKAISTLSHPNVCMLFDVGCEDSTHYIVMELLDGQTLKDAIESQTLPFSSVLAWGIQLCSALESSHHTGIVHRDIKPANIFITRHGNAKLLDFGLAKFVSPATAETVDDPTVTANELTTRGIPIGTVTYMSPEQARGLPATSQSDLFSLGTVLYEMATSCRAFPGTSAAEIFAAILSSTPIAPSRVNPLVPNEFDVVVARLLEKSPEARYPTARDLSTALQNLSSTRTPFPEIQFPYSDAPKSPEAKSPTPSRIKALAVLPLADLSPDAANDYFADGLTEALITAVARLGGVRVISRTSSLCYKNTRKSIPAIAQELNVDAIVEGSVLRTSDHLRLTCRLMDPRTEESLWSETFDRSMRDILSLQDDITNAIATGVRARIQGSPQITATTIRTINPEAYDAYLRGRFFWNKRNEANLRKAIECFELALRLDPHYAPAYAGIADSYFYLGYSFGRMDPNDAMPRAKAAAFRALELDPESADAHTSLGLIQIAFDWDWTAAENNIRRALKLNPSNALAHHFYALLCSGLRRNDEAIAQIQAALQSDPLSLPINAFVGIAHFGARQYEQSITASRKTLELEPRFGLTRAVLGAALEAKGEIEEAAEEYLISLSVGQHDTAECEAVRSAYRTGGIRALHEEDLRQSIRRWDGWHAHSFDIASLAAGLGHISEAQDWLDRAYQAHSGRLIWLNAGTPTARIAQYFDNMRHTPKFESLLRNLKLPI
ncbi:MAG TPA: protein kinase [Candidatus Acidoferrum sp.]|jgi:serine/threonine-protein kinase